MNLIDRVRGPLLIAVLLLLPSVAFAQAAITGVVKDSSGAVLPGVTVEAASPVLIEKVRSVTTNATGQYRIVDLVGSSRVDLQACKLEYSIVSPK